MSRTAVEEIKARLPIEEVIGQYVKLEKAGKSLKARCPFHNEKSASFFVSPDRGGYYCFGCNAKGDIFSFVEQFEGLDFRGALKILAERAGVPLVADQKADGERDRLFQIMEDTASYFEQQFAKQGNDAEATQSAKARDYVKKRGITDETRKSFRIGWAPVGWRNLHTYLKAKGWNDAIMEKAGLVKKSEKDATFYDRFRGRVIFPIADSSGRIVAFSGRILPELDDGQAAKYLNSPDTPLYDKSLVLYGLDKAKSEIRRLNYTILVEGQMDLVMSHQAGIRNTVASSGTALSDEAEGQSGAVSNLGLIRRLSPNVIIAFDSDAAGRKAALRAAGIALGMGMDVKIADLVGSKDPADLVLSDVNEWKNALRSAKPIIEFELGNVLKDTPDHRKVGRALRDRVFPFLARIESQMDKDHFVTMISDRAKVSREAVWDDLHGAQEKMKAGLLRQGSEVQAGSREDFNKNSSKSSRLDLVERRMFGLLSLFQSKDASKAVGYRTQISDIANASSINFEQRLARIEPLLADITFEAEAFYGSDDKRWDLHMKELLVNFEEDTVAQALIDTLNELKDAEKTGNAQKVAELAQKCQVLSVRKAQIAQKRRL